MADFSAPVLRADVKNNAQKIESINQEFKERDIKAAAKAAGLPYLDLKNTPLNQDALRLTVWEEVEKAQALPFQIKGKDLFFASVDPKAKETLEFIHRFEEKGYKILVHLVSFEGIQSTKHYFDAIAEKKPIPVQTFVTEKKSVQDLFKESLPVFEKGTGPEMMNILNLSSVGFHASDIHLEPESDSVRMRMRRDGELYDVLKLTVQQFLLLGSELKRISGLKLNLKSTPQDGSYSFTANERLVNVRVSSLPAKYGETFVLRILDPRSMVLGLKALGFSESQQKHIEGKLEEGKGLMVVTGPTGSGKTSTLYSSLQHINTPEKKIITLEDPIEYELKNAVQSEIHDPEGYSFAKALRAVLRQDPDVIMVGEMRDMETAEIALQASLTGHLVLSTMHANDALSTIPRMLNMGIRDYILASGLELIIAQRLIRKLCEQCKVPTELQELDKKTLETFLKSLQAKGASIPAATFMSAPGCEACAHTKFQGRIAVAEVLPMNDELKIALLSGAKVDQLQKIIDKQGILSMQEDGMIKVLEGKTTIEEVRRVLI